MKLLDFFKAWDCRAPNEYLQKNYRAELQEAVTQGWIVVSTDPEFIHITDEGVTFYFQLRGDFEGSNEDITTMSNEFRDSRLQGSTKEDYRVETLGLLRRMYL